MKKNIKILFILFLLFIASEKASAIDPFTGGVDPHDSLLFDGDYVPGFQQAEFFGENNCFVKVKGMKGVVTGEVIKEENVIICGQLQTSYVKKIKKLEIGDILVEGTTVLTSKDSWVGLGIYLSTDETFQNIFPSMSIIVGESSEIDVPRISDLCKRLEVQPTIPVIKGIVTYESETKDEEELAPLTKITTKGKRSTGKHKKTSYSHEVKIDGNDTLDIIRVYEGAVEVTFIKTDSEEDAAMTKEIEKMGEDMQSGKISMEEMQAKMTEFQNYGQNLEQLLTPLDVSEGNKCIITKTSRKVEPLGPGDEKSK